MCSIKGSVTILLNSNPKGGVVGAILAVLEIFRIHCTVITRKNILSLHVFNRVGTFFTKAATSLESGCFNSFLLHKIFATHGYTDFFPEPSSECIDIPHHGLTSMYYCEMISE